MAVTRLLNSGKKEIANSRFRVGKESPPYLHDGRLFTLEDTVEFFNLVLGTKLTQQEKGDLTTFLRAL
jgi:cytochrome c peroxidase